MTVFKTMEVLYRLPVCELSKIRENILEEKIDGSKDGTQVSKQEVMYFAGMGNRVVGQGNWLVLPQPRTRTKLSIFIIYG